MMGCSNLNSSIEVYSSRKLPTLPGILPVHLVGLFYFTRSVTLDLFRQIDFVRLGLLRVV